MGDHLLRGYLKRRTTEELEAILACCLREEKYANYEYVIGEILSVLRQRDAQETVIKD